MSSASSGTSGSSDPYTIFNSRNICKELLFLSGTITYQTISGAIIAPGSVGSYAVLGTVGHIVGRPVQVLIDTTLVKCLTEQGGGEDTWCLTISKVLSVAASMLIGIGIAFLFTYRVVNKEFTLENAFSGSGLSIEFASTTAGIYIIIKRKCCPNVEFKNPFAQKNVEMT